MKKIFIMKSLVAGLMLVAVTATTPVSGASAERLRLANFMSPNSPYEKPVFKAFADRVAELSKDEVKVKIYSGGELGPGPKEQYNRVIDGVAELVFTLPGYTASHFPRTLLMELPGVITQEGGTKAVWDNVSFIENEFKRTKLIGLWSNAENVLFSNTPIRSIKDVAGLKIRVPSKNAGALVESWGASAVSLPAPAIYNALQTGVIDAAFIDATAVFSFKIGEAAKYATVGMASSISPFAILMNRDSFEALSADQKVAIEQAGREISSTANKVQLGGAKAGLNKFRNMDGKEVIELTAQAASAFNKDVANVVSKIVDEVEAKHKGAQAYVKALQAN